MCRLHSRTPAARSSSMSPESITRKRKMPAGCGPRQPSASCRRPCSLVRFRMYNQPRIFVAGGNSLLGSALRRQLHHSGFEDLVGAPPHEPDLLNAEQVEDFFQSVRRGYVFLTAGLWGGIEENRRFPADLMLDNLLVAAHVIPAAFRHGARKLLNVASSCCYPKLAPQPLQSESLLTGPLEPTN